jgi:pimeloyl-ACP methyl ester carboxylesterase
MRLGLFGLFMFLALLAASPCTALADDLPRRGDLGAAIAPPADGKGARIVRFRPGSALEAAGAAVGDEIVGVSTARAARVPGDPGADANAFGAFVRAARAGDVVTLRIKRGAEERQVRVTLPAMRREAVAGVDIAYGAATSSRGYRVRTYTSRPQGASGRLPVVVFIPWLSCSPVENPLDGHDGWSTMLRDVMRDGGVQLVRIEKPGVGDSDGPDCSQSDLDHDMDAFRAGIRAALADPGADPGRLYLFGGSAGGAMAPILAREFRPKGLIVTGGFTLTWLEHMLDIERRRLTLSGAKPTEVNAAMHAFSGFYDRVLNRGQTPAQALAENPAWKPFWYDEPAHQYGRPMRYYQQLQALDVEGAWADVAVPTLVVWGEYDWIMGRAESDRAVAILAARDPKLATYEIRPRMNHHFDAFPDPLAAFREEGGKYDDGAAAAMVRWLRSR